MKTFQLFLMFTAICIVVAFPTLITQIYIMLIEICIILSVLYIHVSYSIGLLFSSVMLGSVLLRSGPLASAIHTLCKVTIVTCSLMVPSKRFTPEVERWILSVS